jgi:phosphoribosylanthranilate isomerase
MSPMQSVRFDRPAGVDSKTKTDLNDSHCKDLDRMRRFHQAARVAFFEFTITPI